MYSEGEGVPKDDAAAVRWYRQAAEQGFALAQYHLGGMYANGQGVAQDMVEAYAWCSLAVGQSDAHKAMQFGDLLRQLEAAMTAVQLAKARKLSHVYGSAMSFPSDKMSNQ